MPDIYTHRPDIVKQILEEAGFRCGIQPRILPRLPEETCTFQGKNLYGEIYVHSVETFAQDSIVWLLLLVIILLSFALVVFLYKTKKRRK